MVIDRLKNSSSRWREVRSILASRSRSDDGTIAAEVIEPIRPVVAMADVSRRVLRGSLWSYFWN